MSHKRAPTLQSLVESKNVKTGQSSFVKIAHIIFTGEDIKEKGSHSGQKTQKRGERNLQYGQKLDDKGVNRENYILKFFCLMSRIMGHQRPHVTCLVAWACVVNAKLSSVNLMSIQAVNGGLALLLTSEFTEAHSS